MKKITLLWGIALCFVVTTQAQISQQNGARTAQNTTAQASLLADVVDRYEAMGNQVTAKVTDVFTEKELQILRSYLSSQSSSNSRMATLLTENFDDITTLPGAGFDLVNASDAPASDWFQGNPLSFPSQAGAPESYIGANFNSTSGSVINNFMITPPLDLENGDEIIFWSRSSETTPGFDFPDRLEVRIDPTGADTDPANSTDVGSYTELLLEINPTLASMGYPEVWTQFTATVTGLTGTVNTRVAFRYWVTDAGPLGNNSDYIGIDTLTIEEGGTTPPPAMDMIYAGEGIDDEYINFEITDPAGFTVVGPTTADYEAGIIPDPNNPGLGIILGELGTILSIDFATGVYTTLGTITPPANSFWAAMDVDSSGQAYALGLDNTTAAGSLYTVDLTAFTSTLVGANGIGFNFALAIDGNDVAYTVNNVDDSLYTIDLATGLATLVGATGINSEFGQELTVDDNTDMLYWAAFNNTAFTAEWRSIDAATGTSTLIGGFTPAGFQQMMWVSIPLTSPVLTNDECSGAIAMECGDTETGDTTTNTDTGGANASPDAWYSFTGSGTAELITFSLCDGGTGYDSLLTVFDACGGAVVAANDDSCGLQSEVSFLSDGTTTYYVAVEGFGTSAGAFSLAVTCNPVAENDLCDDAIDISCGETVLGSTEFATPDAGSPDCGAGNNSPGVWYVIDDTSGLVTDYTVSLCDGGTTYDSKLVVYSGDCGTLVCVAENDDSCGLQSEVSFQGDGSSTYYILVNGFGTGSSGDFSLNLSCTPVPPFNDMIVNSIDVDEAGLPYTDPSVPMPAATTEAGGTPANCDNAGVLGVWYNFVPENNGTATATVVSPAGYTSVTFYTAPNEEAVETDLTLVDWFDNQCVPGVTTSIPVVAGQAYYVYVANHEGVTDIVIDGDFFLGVGDAVVDGFTYFPNPANNELNLDAGARSIDSAAIYNILGQTVVEQQVGASSTRLDVAALSVGTYILKVVVEGEVGIYKIVKQ